MPKPDHNQPINQASDFGRLALIVDTREQRPWSFPEEFVELTRGTLNAGDYALDGDGFAIERKSLADFVGTVVAGWDRFLRELDRMPLTPARVIIVEANLSDLTDREYPQGANPKFLMSRVAELTLSGVAVIFAGDPTRAAGMAYRIFRHRQAHLTGARLNGETN